MEKTVASNELKTVTIDMDGRRFDGAYRLLGESLMVYFENRAKLIDVDLGTNLETVAAYWIERFAREKYGATKPHREDSA
jgi:hypothetical protein